MSHSLAPRYAMGMGTDEIARMPQARTVLVNGDPFAYPTAENAAAAVEVHRALAATAGKRVVIQYLDERFEILGERTLLLRMPSCVHT